MTTTLENRPQHPPHAPNPDVELQRHARQHSTVVQRLSHPDNPLAQSTRTGSERDALIQLEHDAWNNDQRTMSELGTAIGLSRAAITALCDRLTTAHLIRRRPHARDRRRTNIEITKQGRQLVRVGLAFEPERSAAEAREARATERAVAAFSR